MAPEDIEQIAMAVVRAMQTAQALDGMTAKEHREHHDALQRFIEREARRAELYERIKASAGGWIVITSIGGIGYAVWEWLRTHMR